MLYVHYARGCTLAESFYQSVQGPFQLLIVGDPLCRPFARPPEFNISGVEPNSKVRGEVEISIAPVDRDRIAAFEVFVDGVFRARLNLDQTLKFDSTQLADGRQELRIVAVSNDLLETRNRKILPFYVANESQGFVFSCNKKRTRLSDEIVLKANCPGADKIEFLHNGRVVGSVRREQGEQTISCQQLGGGPITLFARASVGGASVVAEPVELEIR